MSIVPEEKDVIHGKGYAVLKRPGNIYYRTLINSMKVDYDAAPKSLKGIFAHQIVNHIYSLDPPGRFLTKRGKEYEIVDKKKAVKKARQALRDYKMKNIRCPKKLPIMPAVPNDIVKSISNRSSSGSSTTAPIASDESNKKEILQLLEENAELKRKLEKMEKEMKSMIAMNKLAYPSDDSTEPTITSSDPDEDPLDFDTFDVNLDMFLEIENNTPGMQTLENTETTTFSPQLRGKDDDALLSENSADWPCEDSTKSSKLSLLGKLGSYVQNARNSVAIKLSGSNRNKFNIEEENTRMELRLRTLQLMKKYMIKNHIERSNGD